MTEIKFPIYLDHHATTPLDRRVLDEMMPYLHQVLQSLTTLRYLERCKSIPTEEII
jgi:selenocysteine lyase/cysteine desulfurase